MADSSARLRLFLPPRALPVDASVTLVDDRIRPMAGFDVLGCWRFAIDPGPLVLVRPANLSIAVPPGVPPTDLRVFVHDNGDIAEVVGPSSTMTPGHGWLSVTTWYLPPSPGPPPGASSCALCLARRVV